MNYLTTKIQFNDGDMIRNEWNEAREFLKSFTREKYKEMFGKDRNCHKVVRVCLNHARRYGFFKYQIFGNRMTAIQLGVGLTPRCNYDISTYKIEELTQANASKAITKMVNLGLMELVQSFDRDEFGNKDEENMIAVKNLSKRGSSDDVYVRPNRYYFNRFIMFSLDFLMTEVEISPVSSWRTIDLDFLSEYDQAQLSCTTLPYLFHYLYQYLFDVRIVRLDRHHPYNSNIKQILIKEGIGEVDRWLDGKLSQEETFTIRKDADRVLRHYRLNQNLQHQIEKSKYDGIIVNEWIKPLLDDMLDACNELNDLLPGLDFRFSISKKDRDWCGNYFSTRAVCNVTTSRDVISNPNKCDLKIFQYSDGTSFFKRPRTTHRALRYDVLEDYGLDSTSDELYDIKSCLPNLICHYNDVLRDPSTQWKEIDRHSEVCKRFGLRNRNVAKIGAFRGIFNSWKSDAQFMRGIEQNILKSRLFDRENPNFIKETEWMKRNGFMSENGYISRSIMDCHFIPEENIFCQYCADTFNSARACREMYRNDMFPSDLFIIESRAELLTMLHFARQGHRVANAYDHIYSDGRITSSEFHEIFGRYADDSVRLYINCRRKN